ncbi:hypothetical protein E5D57_007222 [Metarhizium anisopliae]|nr:hypothetical protein E5D57_007222 [Metarhizium anisopliae]
MYECDTCTREFYSARSCEQHMNDTGHRGPRKFATESAAEAHMQVQGHCQNYCKSCDRGFQNANNLQMNSFSDGSKASQFQGPPGNSGSMPILPDGLYQRKRPQPPPRNRLLQQRTFTQQRQYWH